MFSSRNIHFAHRTFRWNNKAKGNAAVHVVIIGFAAIDCKSKVIYDYEDINGEAHKIKAQSINQYLVDSPNVIIMPRRKPICQVAPMVYGNKPADGGNLILTDEEKKEIIKSEPEAKKYIKPFLSAKEFLNNKKRWCLWLVNITPSELRALPLVLKRVEAVRKFREESTKAATRELAATPSLFAEIRQAKGEYVLVPRHSSERRNYIPYGFFDKDKIVADSCFCIPDCDMYSWAVIQSTMHTAWVKYTCGRIKK